MTTTSSSAESSSGSGAAQGRGYASAELRPYHVLAIAMVAAFVVSNVTASKAVVLFSGLDLSLGPVSLLSNGLITDGAFFLFPLTYVLGDVITEVYGFKAMRRVVSVGFCTMIAAAAALWLSAQLPGLDPEYAEQFAAVLGVVPQIVLGSLLAFVAGELMNSYVLTWLKAKTGERGLVGRLVGSTVVGELTDTVVFGLVVAPVLGLSGWTLVSFIVVGTVWKSLVEAMALPLTVPFIAWLKRIEPSYQLASAR